MFTNTPKPNSQSILNFSTQDNEKFTRMLSGTSNSCPCDDKKNKPSDDDDDDGITTEWLMSTVFSFVKDIIEILMTAFSGKNGSKANDTDTTTNLSNMNNPSKSVNDSSPLNLPSSKNRVQKNKNTSGKPNNWMNSLAGDEFDVINSTGMTNDYYDYMGSVFSDWDEDSDAF